MWKRTTLAFAAAGLIAGSALALGTASGLKAGTSVTPFDVVDVTGPNKGKQLCYRCQYGNAPVVAAFVKGDPSKATALVAGLQKLVDGNKSLHSFVVFTGGKELKAPLEKLAAEKKISIPLTILPAGLSASDVAEYRINPEVDNTVLLWNQGSVRANFVNVTPAEWANVSKAAHEMVSK